MQIKGNVKYLILAIILIMVIIPKPTFALFFDLFTAISEGEEETAAPIITYLALIILLYIKGLIFLYTSASLLDYTTSHPEWLSVRYNDMVQSGWQFTSGLANLFIVLALIIIAFGFILKIESLQAKKALPRLIIVALLVNFSLVFVGGLIDIANILYNTILEAAGPDLPFQMIEKLGAGGWSIVSNLIIWFLALATAFLIPITSGFSQYLVVTIFFGVAFLPNILTWVLQIILFAFVGGIFLLYAFLFAARVFIVQLLAILSPIFFLCWALPPLKKYWDEWFGHLMEWLFFGVILFFFLVIGLKGADKLMPSGPAPLVPFLGIGSIPDYFYYYFFLVVYLLVIGAWVTMRVMPQIAKAIVEQGKALGKAGWALGAQKLGRAMTGETKRIVAEAPGLKGLREWAQKSATAPSPKGMGLKASLTRPAWFIQRQIGETLGPGVQEYQRGVIDAAEKKWVGKGPDFQLGAYATALTNAERIGAIQAMVKSDNFDDAIELDIQGGGKTLGFQRDEETGKRVITKEGKESLKGLYKTVDTLNRQGVLRAALPDIATEAMQERNPGWTMNDTFDRIKLGHYDLMPKRNLELDEFSDTIIHKGVGEHLSVYGQRFRAAGADTIEKRLDVLKTAAGKNTRADYLYEENRPLYNHLEKWAGQGFVDLGERTRVSPEVGARRRRPGETILSDFEPSPTTPPPSPMPPSSRVEPGEGGEKKVGREEIISDLSEGLTEKPKEKEDEGKSLMSANYVRVRRIIDKNLGGIIESVKANAPDSAMKAEALRGYITRNAKTLGIDPKQFDPIRLSLTKEGVENTVNEIKEFLEKNKPL